MIRKQSRRGSMLLLLLVGSTFSSHVWAQSDSADTAGAPQASEDIIVTAQRRSENLRDVPLSITAVTGTQIRNAGINDTLALTRIAPGLKMDRVGTNLLPAIRGVTTQLTAPGADPNVALYVDGIYQPSIVSNTFDLPDIERVEVLKGPQGTLFGRNATGGAIQVFTRQPENDLAGTFIASYGNLDEVALSGFVTGPIVKDVIMASVTAGFRRNDGFIHDLRNGETIGGLNAKLLRGKLRIEPLNDVRVDLSVFYVNRRDASNSYGNVLNGNTIARFDPEAIIPVRPYDAATNNPVSAHTKSWGVNGKLSWEMDVGTLTSLTAFNKYYNLGLTDGDYSYQPNGGDVFYHATTREQSFTEEVNFASNLEGPLNFVLGLYYVDGKGSWDPLTLFTPTVNISIYGTQHIKALAAFGEIYYDLTDRLRLIGGLRYSWERRSLESGVTGAGLAKPPLNFIGRQNWDSFTPRLSIKYDVMDEANVYFTYSQGFKSGV